MPPQFKTLGPTYLIDKNAAGQQGDALTPISLGVEIECTVVDKSGKPVDEAAAIYDDKRNDGTIVPEFALTSIEFVTPVASSLTVLPDTPEYYQLPRYVETSEQISTRGSFRHDAWCALLSKYGYSLDEVDQAYGPMETSWGPLRVRENTVEVRAADTNLTSSAIAYAALYKGATKRLRAESLYPLQVETTPERYFTIENGKVLIPNFETLIDFETAGAESGFDDESVSKYLEAMVSFSKKGLASTDQSFLELFEEMLNKKENLSDLILSEAKSLGWEEGTIANDDICNTLHLKISEWADADIASLKKKLTS